MMIAQKVEESDICLGVEAFGIGGWLFYDSRPSVITKAKSLTC